MKYLAEITRIDVATIEVLADSEDEAKEIAFDEIDMHDVDFETYETEVKVTEFHPLPR